MHRLLLSFYIFLTGIISTPAQEVSFSGKQNDVEQKARIDSINKAASDPDFIKAYLVYAHPGNAIYSVAGHSLLRLVSPSNNLDIIYTFETDESIDNIFRFFRGGAMAGFVYAPTDTVLEDYRREGRRVEQIQLGLTPRQEQQLWKYLDDQMANREMYRYDFIRTNCTTMFLNALETVIYPSTIEYHNLPKALSGEYGAYREGVFHTEGVGKWHLLFWNLTLGVYADKCTDIDMLLVPPLLWSTWQKATITSPDGSSIPMTTGKPQTLFRQTKPYNTLPVTPMHVAIILLIISLVATFIKACPKWICKSCDIILMSIQTIIGIWLFFLCPIIGTISTDWNIMLGLFNPLPIILWGIFHKKKVMRTIYILFGIIAIVYAMATPLIPQMWLSPCLTMLSLCFALRSFANYRKIPTTSPRS